MIGKFILERYAWVGNNVFGRSYCFKLIPPIFVGSYINYIYFYHMPFKAFKMKKLDLII